MSSASPATSTAVGPVPEDGLAGLRTHWKADLTSGFLVFLIALPLCLGISIASGYPPVAGILTAIVGGLLSTFLGSAHLTIKGPAAGLIVIAVGAVTELGQGDLTSGYHKALAVGVVAAVIQIAFAALRVGRFTDLFPTSVLHGMLAAIGVIILAKQVHVALGVKPEGKEPLHLLAEIPHSIAHALPAVAAIGVVSFLILILWPRLPLGPLAKVPSQLVVLLVAVPAAAWAGLESRFLVDLPRDLTQAVAFPDFSEITSMTSLKYVVMFSLVGTVESLLSAKAIDGLDPWRRRSSMDKDQLAVGVGNLVASLIGGLPMISEIVRSRANIDNGARTRFANFFHGVFLLVAVAFFPALLGTIPLAALAAMLVYTGLRLASPQEFRHTWQIGWDQLTVFLATMITTLATDLLVGVGVGIGVKLVLHLLRGAPLRTLFWPALDVTAGADGESVVVLRDAAIFTNFLGLKQALRTAASGAAAVVVLDLSGAAVVDHTVMQRLGELEEEMEREGRTLRLRGLDTLRGTSPHPQSSRRRA